MKLSDHILRKPFYVAFGQALAGGGITSVDLVATRDATTVTMTASDGSAAPIAGADASTAGVMTAADKTKLDGLQSVAAQDFAARADVATSTIGAGIAHLRTAGHSAAGDGGGALYTRVGAAPSHALKVQSADGAWWEIEPANNTIPFQACGGIEGDNAVNGATNVTAFNNFIGYAQAFFADGIFASGPTLQFPKGDYHFNTHLNVKAGVIIEGAGANPPNGVRGGSVLHFPTNSNGIMIQQEDTIDETTAASTFSGFGTILRGLDIMGGGNTGTTGNGIWMRATAKIIGCRVSLFSLDGVHIVANVAGAASIKGNANQWAMEDVQAVNNGRHGVYVDDKDTNAGAALRVDAKANGRWGIFDSSFLGNSWIGCHTDGNGGALTASNASDESSLVSFGSNRYSANAGATEAQLVATTPGTDETVWILAGAGGVSSKIPLWTAAKPQGTYFHGGSYHTDDINAGSVFIGCYREGNQAENQLATPAASFGGLMGNNKGGGFSLKGTTGGANITGRITFANDDTWFETAARTDLDLIINKSDGKFITSNAGGGSGFLDLFQWSEGLNTWVIGQFNNSGSAIPLYITSGTSTMACGRALPLGGGELVFARGIFIGSSRDNARHQTNGTAAPSSGAHASGEVVWNRAATAGGALGWVCISGGTPGTWAEIRGVGTQTSGANQTALTNSTGGSRDGTLVAVGDTSTANQSAAINGNLTELHTLLDEVRTTLVNFGLMKGGV